MPHALAQAVEVVTTVLAVAGLGYFLAAILAAYIFLAQRRSRPGSFAPGVSILKSLKGLDPGMLDAFRTHCRQTYPGEYELLFGVSSLHDPAVAAVQQLQEEFPDRTIRLVECPERLGTNGKVSTLAQLLPDARHPYLLINDSDISVSPRYLERVMVHFVPGATATDVAPASHGSSDTPAARARLDSASHWNPELRAQGSGPDFSRAEPAEKRKGASAPARAGKRPVGLVTALYRGRAHGTLPSRLEALGIATDFQPSVLLARWMEGGLRYGLGSTLAVSREALDSIGGLIVLADQLADDYELGARIYAQGYRVALCAEGVETSVPAYRWRGFIDHQLRWFRTVRDARPGGYVGLIFTYGFSWALLNVLASGLSPLSLWILAMSFFLRLTLAMTVGSRVLADHHVLPNLWLLPLRDVISLGLWVAGFASNVIVWRGERFHVKRGKLTQA